MLKASCATVICTGLALSFESVRVTPCTTSARLLLAELTARPLIVAAAFAAACVRMVSELFGGSKASPARLFGSPAALAAVMRKPLSTPVALELITRRAPVASVTIDAVMPAPAAFILSRTLARVSVALTVMSTPRLSALAVKPPVAAQVPRSICSVPEPTTAVLLEYAVLATDWAVASFCTVTV